MFLWPISNWHPVISNFYRHYYTWSSCPNKSKLGTQTANFSQNLIFEISLMKIEKIVKNRAKQAKVGCLEKTIFALKTSNIDPIPSKNT